MKRYLKRLFNLVLLLVTFFAMSGCESAHRVSVIMPSGTPLLALGGVIDSSAYDVEVVTDTTLLQTALQTNTTDIVICPLTMGTNLYLKGKTTYKLEAIITTNNAYLISNNPLEPYSNLNDKTIVGFNENNTPGIMLKMFLEQESIVATTQFEANVNASVSAFTQGNAEYAVVAEPQLSKLKAANPNLNVLNLGDLVSDTFVPQAAIFVNSETKDNEEVEKYLNRIKANIAYMNANPNQYIDDYFANLGALQSVGAETLKASIPNASIDYLKASEYKETINAFYSNIDKYCNNMFGGVTPDEGFYN